MWVGGDVYFQWYSAGSDVHYIKCSMGEVCI